MKFKEYLTKIKKKKVKEKSKKVKPVDADHPDMWYAKDVTNRPDLTRNY